jgi:hypothetical protein
MDRVLDPWIETPVTCQWTSSFSRSILDPWNEVEDVHWRVAGASIYRLSTLSWRGFSRRAKTPTRSSRVVWSPRCLGTRSRWGFSLRAKTHTHTRRVVWSPRPTALAVGYNAKKSSALYTTAFKKTFKNGIFLAL